MMTVSDLIDKLKNIYIQHGDLEVEFQDKEINFLTNMDISVGSILENE